MADWSDVAVAAQAVGDPSTSAADLAAIVGAQRGLWAQIAGHPNAYPALLEWLSAQGDDTVRAAVASRQQPVAPTAPVAPSAPVAPIPVAESAPVMAQQPVMSPQQPLMSPQQPAVAQQPMMPQQPMMAPQPMMPQQPMMGTVPPMMGMAGVSAPRKSRTKPLLIGGGVLLVAIVVVVVLVIHSTSSILRYDQLPTFVDILNAEHVELESPGDMVDEMDLSDMPSSSSSCYDLYQARNKILGGAEFDIPNVDFEDDSVVLILTNHKTALSFSDSMMKCISNNGATKVSSQTTNGVSLSVWTMSYGDDEARVAVYKNVILFTGDYDSYTRAEWKSYMTSTFKSAVDRAIKS